MPQTLKGSLKLSHILDALAVDPAGLECSDLGCNVGGFTKELLDRGAKQVHAIDTGYGALDWNLRQHESVDVRERTNALHSDWLPPQDLIVSDLAWTRQSHVIDAAFRYIHDQGIILSLLKPQYEVPRPKGKKKIILSPEECSDIAQRVFAEAKRPETHECSLHDSPIRGGRTNNGNTEFWLVYTPKKA